MQVAVNKLSHIIIISTSKHIDIISINPDSKVHGANMGPIWVLSAPVGPHVCPMNLAIREILPDMTVHFISSRERSLSSRPGRAQLPPGTSIMLPHHNADIYRWKINRAANKHSRSPVKVKVTRCKIHFKLISQLRNRPRFHRQHNHDLVLSDILFL